MNEKFGIIAIAAIILIAIIPLSFYYLGTVGGVSASGMTNDLIYLGAFLFVFFIALLAIFGRRR